MIRRVALIVMTATCIVHPLRHAIVSADSEPAPRLLVANQGDRTLLVFDAITGQRRAELAEDETTGHEVEASPDGHTAYVPIYGNSGVGKPGTDGSVMDVLDLDRGKIAGKVDFGHGVRPHCVKLNPKDGMLYVTTELDKTVTIVDPKTLKIVGTVPTGQPESHMLAITRDGQRGYTANVGPGTVSVLDLVGRKTIAVIPISRSTQRISLSVDDKLAFTADQTKAQLAVIDTATNKIKQWIPLPAIGYGTAPTPDGSLLLVAMQPTKQIAVIDLKSSKIVRTVDLVGAPAEIVIPPDGKEAFASMPGVGSITRIPFDTWRPKYFGAGRGADGMVYVAK